jgi:acetoin utilization deacetylase AcuC-like enzyme
VHVVWSEQHRLHAPEHELHLGSPIPTYERPERAERIRAELAADDGFDLLAPTDHGRAPVEAVHDPGLVAFLERAWAELHQATGRRELVPEVMHHAGLREGMGPARPPADAEAAFGYWCFETATPLTEGTYEAARASVDVALTAADLVLAGERAAYGLCRPPGHHAARAVYGGFCFFNNAAIVAEHLARTTGGPVSVLDVDYHHGNGTQQIFYDRADVQVVSLHGDPRRAYPWYTGHADEVGSGRGRGATLNLPLPAGTGDDDYLTRLGEACEAVQAFGAEVLVVSLGVDTYWNDPISDLALTADGYERCGALVAELGLPTVVLQEGGYDLEAIGRNVHRWLCGLRSARSA